VDFTRKILCVTHSKTAGGEAREIPLTERLFADLEARRQPEGIVFTFDKQPISRIKTAWKGALRRAGVRTFRFHDLRHAFNTRLLEAGVMQEVRKALMGHSSGEDVNSIYTHIELPAKREAIQKLECWVAAQRAAAKEKEEKEKEEANARTADNDGGNSEGALPES
jgi:integrase